MGDRGGILVPVSESPTADKTIEYAVGLAEETGQPLHLVRSLVGYDVEGRVPEREERLINHAEQVARSHGGPDLSLETAILGAYQYMASPAENVGGLLAYAKEKELERIILDPNFSFDSTSPRLQDITSILDGASIRYEQAPVTASRPAVTGPELVRAGTILALSFAFYLALAGDIVPFYVASALASGLIAAAMLRNVAFETTPPLGVAIRSIARSLIFAPWLIWEIIKANILFTYVVLHPSLPIDPGLDRVDAAVNTGLSVTAFANAITLTPGTLTVDADGHYLLVHSLNMDARDDLLEGVHEKIVRYLFYGREAAELEGPGPRGDYQSLKGPAASEEPGGEDSE